MLQHCNCHMRIPLMHSSEARKQLASMAAMCHEPLPCNTTFWTALRSLAQATVPELHNHTVYWQCRLTCAPVMWHSHTHAFIKVAS